MKVKALHEKKEYTTIREMVEDIGKIYEGIHMEGPYMSGYTGGQTLLKWPRDRGILKEDYIPLVQENKDLIKMWAVDPTRI